MSDVKLVLEIVRSAYGYSVYINDYSVAGSKSWGAHETVAKLSVDPEDLHKALAEFKGEAP